MADTEHKKETFVVDKGDRRASYSGVWIVGIILLIILLFFMFGGANMFGGGTATPTTGGGSGVTAPSGAQ